jgi:uncharacterized membrane protein
MRRIVRFFTLYSNILVTGVFFTTLTSVSPVTKKLPADTYTEIQSGRVRALEPIMAPLVPGAFLANLWLLWLERKSFFKFLLTFISLICNGLVNYFTIAHELPVNTAVKTWNPQKPPSDWADQRARWEKYHQYRTIAALIGLTCLLWSAILPDKPKKDKEEKEKEKAA